MCSIHMSKILYTCQIVCLLFLVGGLSCSAFQCPVDVGSIARELLARFSAPDDSLRYRAAEYLLEGLPYQWHYDVKKLDETDIKVKVMDVEVLDAEYLAENIEYAFRAWELPWARDLSFKDFCRYLLPYKMGNEAPERWRAAVWNEFSWVLEQADRTTDATAVCRWIDDYVNSWYTVNLDYNYPADAGYLKAKEIRQGTCQGASLMVMYPLRALGVAATYDYVPQWGNRSGRHNWNALYDHGYLRTFNGPDRNPGEHKVEFIGVGRMYFRRPKIYRKEYLNAGSVDVTSEYLPSVDVSVPMRGARNGDVHLAVVAILRLLEKNSPIAAGLICWTVFSFASYPLSVPKLAILLTVFLAASASVPVFVVSEKMVASGAVAVVSGLTMCLMVKPMERLVISSELQQSVNFRRIYENGYPLVRLMRLQIRSGQDAQALETAGIILDKPITPHHRTMQRLHDEVIASRDSLAYMIGLKNYYED